MDGWISGLVGHVDGFCVVVPVESFSFWEKTDQWFSLHGDFVVLFVVASQEYDRLLLV